MLLHEEGTIWSEKLNQCVLYLAKKKKTYTGYMGGVVLRELQISLHQVLYMLLYVWLIAWSGVQNTQTRLVWIVKAVVNQKKPFRLSRLFTTVLKFCMKEQVVYKILVIKRDEFTSLSLHYYLFQNHSLHQPKRKIYFSV